MDVAPSSRCYLLDVYVKPVYPLLSAVAEIQCTDSHTRNTYCVHEFSFID
jgi:hypothetical protein